MGQTITFRLPDDLAKEIERIAEIEQLDKSSVVRRLLAKAIAEWNVENALNGFQQEKLSLGRAVEESHLSIWEFLEKLHDRRIPLHYDLEDFQEDLRVIEEAKTRGKSYSG
jgi:predicted HTH domain antitoxin